MTKYFVSTTGSDTANTGLSASSAFASLSKACSVLANNDEIEVAGGTYTGQNGALVSGKSGFKIYAAAGAVPNINTLDTAPDALKITNCNGFNISFLEFTGVAKSITLAEADNGRTSFQARYDGNGVTINDSYNFLVQGVRVQDYPGAGIACTNCDYVQVDRCQARRCTAYSAYGTQGITFLTAQNSPGSVSGAERIKATNNVCYDNVNQIAWTLGGGNGQINEGNGLYNDTTRSGSTGTYTGVARFDSNVCVFNGGAGIQSLRSCPITIKNNYCGANTRNVNYGEIQVNTLLSPSAITTNFISVTNPAKNYIVSSGTPAPTITGNIVRGTTAQVGVTGSQTFVS